MEKRILICDDDGAILEVTSIVLSQMGCQVKTLTTFKNVFRIIDEFKPDLVILDLWMPQIGGEVIAKKIKTNPKYQSISVVLFSASKNTAILARESGADDYLFKPFNVEDLETKVQKLLKYV